MRYKPHILDRLPLLAIMGLNRSSPFTMRHFVGFLRTASAEAVAFYGATAPVFACTFPVRHRARKPKGFLGLAGYYTFGWGTPILAGTWEAAYWAAQCALSAADYVRAGERVAYALAVRLAITLPLTCTAASATSTTQLSRHAICRQMLALPSWTPFLLGRVRREWPGAG
jgi:hypothetical protein